MLRYSNRSIFSVREEWPKAWMWKVNDIGDVTDVEQIAEAYMLKRDHPKFKGN